MKFQFTLNNNIGPTTIKQGRNMIFDGTPENYPNINLAFKVFCCDRKPPKETTLFIDMLLNYQDRDPVKWIKILNSNHNYRGFVMELEFYKKFHDNKYVIKLKGLTSTAYLGETFKKFSQNEYPLFIFDKYDYDLLQWVNYMGSNDMTTTISQLKPIMLTLLKGLVEIHKQGVIHHDIKCANILFMKNPPSVVFCDFGAAIYKENTVKNKKIYLSTICNRAPERFLELDFDERVDVYGLGCVFYILIAGGPLFPCFKDNTRDEVVKCLTQRRNVIKRLHKTIKDVLFRDLLIKMLKFKKDDRLFAMDCLNHRFFMKKRKRYSRKTTIKQRKHKRIKF